MECEIGYIKISPVEFNAMGFVLLSCGIISILAGIILLKKPPKRINFLYGYRTNKSMRNQQSWDFAQMYSGKNDSIWLFACFGIAFCILCSL